MIRKLACAVVVMVVGISFVAAEEFSCSITKVDGNKITYQKYKKGEKGKKGEKDGPEVTIEVAKDAKIAKGKVSFKDKKFAVEVGDAIEGGLKAEAFAKASAEKGVNARITTDADNKKVTQILLIQFGGKKKKTTTE